MRLGLCRYAQVMDEALAMHDECLRSVLHTHCGYEVRLTVAFILTICAQRCHDSFVFDCVHSVWSLCHARSTATEHVEHCYMTHV